MKTFILVSAFTNISATNNRTRAIIDQIVGEKTVVTTDFDHSKKRYYEAGEAEHSQQVLLHVPGYKKNLCVARIWSHLMFAWRVRGYLKALKEKPVTVYCTMPTSSSAYVCARYCKRNRVKFVIDVIDLWPDSLLPLVRGKAFIKALLSPWTYLTRYAYRHADVIMGESVAYANEAKKCNSMASVYPVYLGVNMDIVNQVKANNPISLEKPNDEVWIAYAGSLGTSYDFEALLDAVKNVHGNYKYKLWFIGDGVRRNDIETFVKDAGLNVEITGFLPYEQLLGYLSYCDIAVNIFRKSTKVVYSYKFNDYVAMDCFVLNSLEGETSDIVDEYQIGRNFDFDQNSLSIVLNDTFAHWENFKVWKNNNERLIEEKLDKSKIYSICKEIFNDEIQ